jgi:hypothetical protein
MANTYTSDTPEVTREVTKLLDQVKSLLDAGKPHEALKLLSRDGSEWARNARAVCYLRLGDAQAAVDMLRGLVVSGHINLRHDAPLIFKTNFATALFLSGNIDGGASLLHDLRNERHDSVQKLRAAVEKWKSNMSFWEKLRWRLGGKSAPFSLDYPPGDL